MGLGLDPLERLARARADLRMGAAVALRDDGGAALVLAAETATRGAARRPAGARARSTWR